jgi:hypothetical protein
MPLNMRRTICVMNVGRRAPQCNISTSPPRETRRFVARRTTVYQRFSPPTQASCGLDRSFAMNNPPRPLSLFELPLALLLQTPSPLEAFICHSSDLGQPRFFTYAHSWAYAHGSRGVHADVVERKTPDVRMHVTLMENTHRMYLCVYACIHAYANTLSRAQPQPAPHLF